MPLTSRVQETEGRNVRFGVNPPNSHSQPVLHFDEFMRSDRGPVSTEIIHFLCEQGSAPTSECIVIYMYVRLPLLNTPRYKRCCVKRGGKMDSGENVLSSFEPFHTRATSHSPNDQWISIVDFHSSLGMIYVFAWIWDTHVFDLHRELVYHCRHSGVGHSILGEREGQEATGELIGGVNEYAPAHWAFDVFVPSSTRPVESGKEVLDHANCTEGVAAVWVRHCHGVCSERDRLMRKNGGRKLLCRETYIISKHLSRSTRGGLLSNRSFEDVREAPTKHM